MKILLVDNYDSFTFNLVHYLEGLDCDVTVERNDEINFDRLEDYDKIVLSPGPGLPSEANDLMKLIRSTSATKPILGVCLGFQALVEYFKGTIYNQDEIIHGQSVRCNLDNTSRLFKNLPEQIEVGLYHSWAANKENLPEELTITAQSNSNVIMAFEHKSLPIVGVQFHPESILTEKGKDIIRNFLINFN